MANQPAQYKQYEVTSDLQDVDVAPGCKATAAAALGLSPSMLEKDLKTFGFLFEAVVARDLAVYSTAMNGKLSYYRDRYGLEADFVLHLDDGRYALVECKLGEGGIEEGKRHLAQLRALIRKNNSELARTEDYIEEPSLLIIITGGRIAYTTEDDIHIVPIGCLGP